METDVARKKADLGSERSIFSHHPRIGDDATTYPLHVIPCSNPEPPEPNLGGDLATTYFEARTRPMTTKQYTQEEVAKVL